MKSNSLFRRTVSVSITMLWLSTAIPAEDAAPEATPAPSRPTRAELRDKQYDVSLDARDIERILTRLKRASELSKQRMTEAAEAAEGVAGAIERDPAAARARAAETAKMFQEIAKLLEALLTEETPQKLAAARNIAAQLAKAEQQFAQQAQAMSKEMMEAPTAASGQGKADPKQPPKSGQGKGGEQREESTAEIRNGTNGSTPDSESPDKKTGDKGGDNTPPKDPPGNNKNSG